MASEYVILAIYVDDINLVGTSEKFQKEIEYLKKEFEMKDLGKTKLCLGLQIEYLADEIFIHQSAYTERVLKRFYMDKMHALSTPIVARSLELRVTAYTTAYKQLTQQLAVAAYTTASFLL
ncbi:uncharacterized mitochondrial protein AtMg00810-like [Nicotiana tomentosiformis]|uniref:uncharacterized mitochondrial protein AtMg00810-like n=1 Tax=Nicotiana tomentosiformis TaxID=4098 RepID=UPI00388C999A